MSDATFGDLLREARRAAALSQLQLAVAAGVSQRHLSFLESGRASPGREVVTKLAEGLGLAPEAANNLLDKAGFTATSLQRDWKSADLAPLRSAAAHILKGHMPYPAILVDITGDLIEANPAFDHALSLLGDPQAMWRRTHGAHARNLYRLTLHPEGPSARLLNFAEVARATLQRAAMEAQRSPRLTALLDEIATWRNIDCAWRAPLLGVTSAPIVEERYQVGEDVVSVFAVTTTIGAPTDLGFGALRIESYFPADPGSAALMERASGAMR